MKLRERGQALTELALVMPLLLMLGAGGTDLARGISEKTAVTNAAREGARAAALPEFGDPQRTSPVNCADYNIWKAAEAESPSLPWPALSACIGSGWTAPAAASGKCSLTIAPLQGSRSENVDDQPVTVTVSCPYTALTPVLSSVVSNVTVASSSTANAYYPSS